LLKYWEKIDIISRRSRWARPMTCRRWYFLSKRSIKAATNRTWYSEKQSYTKSTRKRSEVKKKVKKIQLHHRCYDYNDKNNNLPADEDNFRLRRR
jgi:hypothetical protein